MGGAQYLFVALKVLQDAALAGGCVYGFSRHFTPDKSSGIWGWARS